MADRLFTREEANRLLPTLAPLLERAREVSAMLGDRDRQRRLRSVTVGNGGGEAAREMMAEGDELSRVVAEIAGMGVVVRDPTTGLVDFLGTASSTGPTWAELFGPTDGHLG